MAANRPERAQRRIAVILGAGGSGRNLLDLLLPLLGRDRDIEMYGVFLEEAEVRHAAELPFVQELCRVTFSVREFTSEGFDRALALRMRTAEHALDLLARRVGVRHSFRNVRGQAISLLRETARSSDITLFEPVNRLALNMAPALRGRMPRRRLAVALSDLESGHSTLRAARHLAEGDARRIALLVTGPLAQQQPALWALCEEVLQARPARIRMLPNDAGVRELIEAAHGEGASLLVMTASDDLLESPNLQLLRERLRCPICLVRSWGARHDA